MKGSRLTLWAGSLLTTFAIAQASDLSRAAGHGAPAAKGPAAHAEPQGTPSSSRQAELGRFPERDFTRLDLAALSWNPTEGNKLGVQTAVLEGDPSKPGFYLTINRFPPGVMSRPHTHPDERHCVVLKGTWYTGEGTVFAPEKTVALKPGDYMRHPAGGPHFDGALDEEVLVLISGYGPTRADVIGGGELFARSRPAN